MVRDPTQPRRVRRGRDALAVRQEGALGAGMPGEEPRRAGTHLAGAGGRSPRPWRGQGVPARVCLRSNRVLRAGLLCGWHVSPTDAAHAGGACADGSRQLMSRVLSRRGAVSWHAVPFCERRRSPQLAQNATFRLLPQPLQFSAHARVNEIEIIERDHDCHLAREFAI